MKVFIKNIQISEKMNYNIFISSEKTTFPGRKPSYKMAYALGGV